MNSEIISQFSELLFARKKGIPQLWKSEQRAIEFADFIFSLAKERNLKIIEIHPPFTDYCDFETFIHNYKSFEKLIVNKYPNIEIFIENRFGSLYHGDKFLISKNEDVITLCHYIEKNKLRLKIAYDIPQIYSAHNVTDSNMYVELLEEIKPYRTHIGGVHLWGKRKNDNGRKVAHCGDLNSYFDNDTNVKMIFIKAFMDLFDDEQERKLVLEVNSSNEDLISIVDDLILAGVKFV